MITVNFELRPHGAAQVSAWTEYSHEQPNPEYTIEPSPSEIWPHVISLNPGNLVKVNSGDRYATILLVDRKPIVIDGTLEVQLSCNGMPMERDKAEQDRKRAAYNAATSAFCSYHSLRQSDLEEWHWRYISEEVYPIFLAANDVNKVCWP